MKKLSLIPIILIVIALFAFADYYLNNLNVDVGESYVAEAATSDEGKDLNDAIFKPGEDISGYKVVNQVQVNQVFEKIDLSNIKNIKIYRNRLDKIVLPGAENDGAHTDDKPESLPSETSIYLYEIHGPKGQGSITYLNVKLQFIAQINTANETLNETGGHGNNSFFFNDLNYSNIAFLLVQISDNLYAFQYNKQKIEIFNDVRSIISKLMGN